MRWVPALNGDVEEMAACIVEEFVKMGLDDAHLFSLFQSPFYAGTHRIYQQKGEQYVRALIEEMRSRWSVPGTDSPREPASNFSRRKAMPTVYNWQLGRKMHSPYEERHPRWQFAAVFNTNRCIGCQTCTMACKSTWTFSKGQEYMWWNNVESKPYGGYPQFWDMKLLHLLDEAHQREGTEAAWDPSQKDGAQRPYGVFEGMTIFEAALQRYGPEGHTPALGSIPSDEEWRAPNIFEDTSPPYEGG